MRYILYQCANLYSSLLAPEVSGALLYGNNSIELYALYYFISNPAFNPKVEEKPGLLPNRTFA